LSLRFRRLPRKDEGGQGEHGKTCGRVECQPGLLAALAVLAGPRAGRARAGLVRGPAPVDVARWGGHGGEVGGEAVRGAGIACLNLPHDIKHTYLDELLPYAQRQQSIVAYHHADRSAAVEEQAERRLAALAAELPLTPLAAVRASRGSTRLFLVAAAPAREGLLRQRLQASKQVGGATNCP
jgi:hypothetical protein